jgi:protein-S-isoprenylcysteine O-methyltransferase Ste14
MNSDDIFHDLIQGPWLVFVVYWIISGLKTRATVQQEPFASRYGVLALEIAGFLFLFNQYASIGVLRLLIFPRTMTGAVAGTVATWAGIGLALWARFHLGQYWSARITLKDGHKLIRTGPYARLRHPIYTGLDLAAIGSAVAIDHWRCALGVCLIIVGYVIKARREERLLAGQFGAEFEEHRKHTGFLLPRLR